MFYTPKPRQFKYVPRFYDPEKERWEALKQKYADERALESLQANHEAAGQEEVSDRDLEYFERRVRQLDRQKEHRLGWKDLVRKREMPKFNYQPRFATEQTENEETHAAQFKKRTTSIKRRFDPSDTDYMKPIPAGRIMLYALLVCALLYWIFF